MYLESKYRERWLGSNVTQNKGSLCCENVFISCETNLLQ